MSLDFEYMRNEICIYINNLKKNNVNIETYKDIYSTNKVHYKIPYQKDSIDFLNKLSDIPKNVIKQFLTLNQLRYLVMGYSNDIYIFISIDDNSLSVIFSNDIYLNSMFKININKNNGRYITYTYRNRPINNVFDYEIYYNKILKDINSIINPEAKNISFFLNLFKNKTKDVIQERLNQHSIKYKTHSELILNLKINDFKLYIKDIFPELTYRKILQLISLFELKRYISNLDKMKNISLIFPKYISKYSHYNEVFTIDFSGVHISLMDNGEFFYQEPEKDVPVYIYDTDINVIYNYFLNNIKEKISSKLSTLENNFNLRYIELYKISMY